MAKYTSKSFTVNSSAESVAEKFKDLTLFQDLLNKIPEDQRSKIGDVKLSKDTIELNPPQTGKLVVRITERTPELVKFSAEGSPLPINLLVNIKPVSADSSELSTALEAEIPAFLKPMVGGTLQKAADQFSELIKKMNA